MRSEDVLSVLRHAGRPMTARAICGELLMEPTRANCARVLSRLRELRHKGMVRRVDGPTRASEWMIKEDERDELQ